MARSSDQSTPWIRTAASAIHGSGVYARVPIPDGTRIVDYTGERAGPPEDCGGLEAFHDMLACIKEPHTELGREWLEWLGPDYDPEACDLEKINKALKKLGK